MTYHAISVTLYSQTIKNNGILCLQWLLRVCIIFHSAYLQGAMVEILCLSQGFKSFNYRKIKTRANRDGRIRAKREDKINRKNIFTMKTKLVVHKWFCRLSLLILYLRARDNLKTKSWDKFHILPVFLFYFFLLRNDEAFL